MMETVDSCGRDFRKGVDHLEYAQRQCRLHETVLEVT
jgi:hypothetical protein